MGKLEGLAAAAGSALSEKRFCASATGCSHMVRYKVAILRLQCRVVSFGVSIRQPAEFPLSLVVFRPV